MRKSLKIVEEQLEHYKFFFNNSPDLLCIANVKGYFEVLNSNWKKVLGYSDKELFTNQFLYFVHPDDVAATLQEIEKLKTGATSINFVNRYRKQNGDYVYLDWNTTPDPVTGKLYAIARDITQRRETETNLKAIFNSAFVSIIKTDIHGTITHFNKGAEILLGYSADEVIGKHTPAIIHLETEVAERGSELTKIYGREIRGFDVLVELPNQGKHESKKWTYKRKDGTTFPVQLVVTAITDNERKIEGFLGIATDISDLEKVKEELSVLSNYYQKQNNQLLNFAYIISHNLRSPVGNLNSLLKFYKESKSDEEKGLLLNKFETVIHNLTETLNELTETLKTQEEINKEHELLTFEEVFTKIKETLAGHIIETSALVTADFCKAKQIKYPKSYLESMMLNLFSNALKYRSPKRAPKIHFETNELNNEISLSVSDNGLGIDLLKYRNQIFGLNKTFHSHTEAKGIGLYITKKQVEAMGGCIEVESEVDKGTTFTIYFNKKALH